MRIPKSIQTWIEFSTDIKKIDPNGSLSINADIDTSIHTGHIFFKENSYPFSFILFKNNMLFSLKKVNDEIINLINYLFQEEYKIYYKAELNIPKLKDYCYHLEWYFNCELTDIKNQIKELKNHPSVDTIINEN